MIEALAARKAASAIQNGGVAAHGAIYPLPWAAVVKLLEQRTGARMTEQKARHIAAEAMAKARKRARNQVVFFFE